MISSYCLKDYVANAQRSNHLPQDFVELPPFSESDGYRVLEGNPVASVRMDVGDGRSQHRLGLWRCTPGSFSCTEKGDELQTILCGRLTLIDSNGVRHSFAAGDSVYTTKGSQVTWQITETVIKVFFTHDHNGI